MITWALRVLRRFAMNPADTLLAAQRYVSWYATRAMIGLVSNAAVVTALSMGVVGVTASVLIARFLSRRYFAKPSAADDAKLVCGAETRTAKRSLSRLRCWRYCRRLGARGGGLVRGDGRARRLASCKRWACRCPPAPSRTPRRSTWAPRRCLKPPRHNVCYAHVEYRRAFNSLPSPYNAENETVRASLLSVSTSSKFKPPDNSFVRQPCRPTAPC